MSQEQVFEKITALKKWYIGYCSQQTASAIVKRYKNGTLSHEKITELFSAFGYQKVTEQWIQN